jgi:hypothetical protein
MHEFLKISLKPLVKKDITATIKHLSHLHDGCKCEEELSEATKEKKIGQIKDSDRRRFCSN